MKSKMIAAAVFMGMTLGCSNPIEPTMQAAQTDWPAINIRGMAEHLNFNFKTEGCFLEYQDLHALACGWWMEAVLIDCPCQMYFTQPFDYSKDWIMTAGFDPAKMRNQGGLYVGIYVRFTDGTGIGIGYENNWQKVGCWRVEDGAAMGFFNSRINEFRIKYHDGSYSMDYKQENDIFRNLIISTNSSKIVEDVGVGLWQNDRSMGEPITGSVKINYMKLEYSKISAE